MNEQHIEDIISALYDMIQDARALPLGADKCILERDKVLDMLDEIIAQLPSELKQSRTIVESRNELIGHLGSFSRKISKISFIFIMAFTKMKRATQIDIMGSII